MEEWILNQLLKQLLKWLPIHADPTEWKATTWIAATRPPPIDTPTIPPDLARKLVDNWLEFPREYAAIADKAFHKLKPSSPMFAFTLAEWLRLTSAFDGFIPEIALSNDFPLSVPTFRNWALFDEVHHFWSVGLDFESGLYPAETSIEFDYTFWLIVWVCRIQIIVHRINEVSKRLDPKRLPSRAAR